MARPKRPQPSALDLGPAARPVIRGGGFLHEVTFEWPSERRDFPFNIPAFSELQQLEFHPAVTFFIGENGTGKSTLLEALAVKAGFHAEGGWKRRASEDLAASSGLDQHLSLTRGGYPGDGWFLRAETFFNVASDLEERGSTYAGKNLHAQSHGEAFLALLNHRLTGDGLYFFDEPEAALSPQRQLAVLTLLHRLVRHRSQLVIATHSPILLAYPHARIYEFSDDGIKAIKYEETEHFRITRDFLAHRERMVELLLQDEEDGV